MPSSPAPQQAIFTNVKYSLSSSYSPARADELRHVLESNGATRAENGMEDPKLTLVITNSNRFEGWESVAAREGVDIVTDKWVEKSLILGKVQSAQHYSADPAMIFSGVVACASDLPSADLEVLSAGITALGGQWRMGLSNDVTHLFAITPGSAKYSTALHHMDVTGIRVVLPHWFDDAVRLGMGGLPTKPYEWPDPDILKGVEGLAAAGKSDGKGKSAVVMADLEKDEVKKNMYATAAIFTPGMNQSTPPAEADISLVVNTKPLGSSIGTSAATGVGVQVWNGRKILLSRTLQLYKGRREAVHVGVERAGGGVLRFEGDEEEEEAVGEEEKRNGKEMSPNERVRRRKEAEKVEDCDVLVTRWRYGRAYIQAVKLGKTIGTLAWLFHVQSTGIFTRPLDQLLHFPVPKRPIESFSNHVITLTNYTGEAREYLKKLIVAMGATFTPSMSGQNTVLIAAFVKGTKALKAQSWSIPVVNHTWLEDCFVQWRNLTMALEKYIVFPPNVDFSSLLGERGVGIGRNIESEVDELGVMTFEEDDVQEQQEHAMEVDAEPPNGTDASMKEVARGLVDVDGDGDAIMAGGRSKRPPSSLRSPSKSKPNSEPTPKSKPRAPAGMDVEFMPPSTMMVANNLDWNIDFGSDDGRDAPSPGLGRESMEIDEEDLLAIPLKKGPPKRKAMSAKVESPKKPTYQPKLKEKGKRKAVEDEGEGEDAGAPSKLPTKGKKKKDEIQSEDEEAEDPVVPPKKASSKAKSKAKKHVEEDVIELDNSDSEEERPKPSKPTKGKATKKAVSVSSDEGDAVEQERPKPQRPKPVKSTAVKSPAVYSSKAKGKAKAKPLTPESEDASSEEEEPPVKPKRKAKLSALASASTPSKSKRARLPTSSQDDASETETEVEPQSQPKPPTKKLVRRVTVELEKTVDGVREKATAKRTTINDQDTVGDSSESYVRPSSTKKTKPTVAKPNSTISPSKSTTSKPSVLVTTPTSGLLKTTKGDARTRIKKKKAVAESEGETESEVEAKAKVVKGKGKGNSRKLVEEVDEEEEEDVRPTKASAKTNAKAPPLAKASGPKTKGDAKPATPGRSKPLRVYSTDEDDDDDDTNTNAADVQIDINKSDSESLPEVPLIRPKTVAKEKAKEAPKSKAIAAETQKVQDKDRSKLKGKKKATTPSESEEEEEEEEKRPAKKDVRGRANNSNVEKTPKRTVSVLAPTLSVSGSKPKGKRKQIEEEDDESDEEEVQERKRKNPVVGTKEKSTPTTNSKSKSKPAAPSIDSDDEEEEEVTNIISPRSKRALGRTESLKVVAGQSSTSSAKLKESKGKATSRTTEIASTSISVLHRPSKRAPPAPESMEVDETPSTHAASSTPGSTLSVPPPRRNAATKATQRLHETIMPDLVNFEAQMKKSKGKGRQSASSLGAFAHEFEKNVARDERTKRKKSAKDADAEDDDEDLEEVDEDRRKKRRVSDENDDQSIRVPPKSKGKQKVNTGDDDVEMVDARRDDKRSKKVDSKAKPKDGGSGASSSDITVMTTQVVLADDVIKALTKLGVKFTTRPSECTHLISPGLVRTEKFLCALVGAPFILSEKWATTSAASKALLPEKNFLLKDKVGEKKYGVDLVTALRRAKENAGKLLDGHTFYITPRVAVDKKLLKNVVTACGGLLTNQTPSARIISTNPTTRHVISCKEDVTIWRQIASQGYKIFSHELLLDGVMKQEVEWDKEDFLVRG